MKKRIESSIVVNKEILRELYHSWYPMGSGPIIAMRIISWLIQEIWVSRGWDIEELLDTEIKIC